MKRVLLVVDSHSWCFGHIAKGIKKYAPDEYEVTVVDSSEFYYLKKHEGWHLAYDAVCQFAWSEATQALPIRNVTVVAHEGIKHPYPYPDQDSYLSSISTAIRNKNRARQSLPKFAHVIFFNPSLAVPYLSTYSVLMPGVDTEIFFSKDPLRAKDCDASKKLRIGWSGQRGCRHKGEDILHGVIQRLTQIDANGFHFVWNDRKAIDSSVCTQQEMAAWYRDLDVFLCTSASEGGPMTVVEAAACGVPVVSTDVGFVGNISSRTIGACISSTQKEAAISDLACHILDIRNMPQSQYRELCKKSLSSVFSWEKQAALWLEAIYG